MRMYSLTMQNFRGYRKKSSVVFSELTAFVGKNDIGKSTVLEALDIFFNDGKGAVKLEKADVNIQEAKDGHLDIELSVVFEDLPAQIVIDTASQTTLIDEYLLNEERRLEVIKRFHNGGSPKVYIRAQHPNNPMCQDLLLKKNNELKKTAKENGIECDDHSNNVLLRRAIWQHYQDDLQLQTKEIDVSKEDAKRIWDRLSAYMPIYSLFQADRKNSDGDSEAQDPLQAAVKEIISNSEIQATLSSVAEIVTNKLREVSDRTLSKIKDMDPNVAQSLTPVIPNANELKWAEVFKKVSITGDDDIPINKRGSGIKRLILLNFFRAEAEKQFHEGERTGVIYAIEEPETSQHSANQRVLINALIDLSHTSKTQVIITTHSGTIVKELKFDNIRLITEVDKEKSITVVKPTVLQYPSLNEINYRAFGELSEEYHNELYGFMMFHKWDSDYKKGKKLFDYKQIDDQGRVLNKQYTQTDIIRHQIHHPENTLNKRFTPEELEASIEAMRCFIRSKAETEGVWDPIEEA